WTLRATIPWLQIDGPAAVVASGGSTAGGPVRPSAASTSGLGDSILGLTYKLNPDAVGLHTDLTAKVKFPTGDDSRGLGTGEFDYYGQIDFYQSFNGITPSVTGGYRVLGDGRYQLDDGFYGSGGLVFLVADRTTLGASLDWRQRIVAGGDDALESTVFFFRQFNPNWSGTFYGQTGFTDASADYGLGTSFSFSF